MSYTKMRFLAAVLVCTSLLISCSSTAALDVQISQDGTTFGWTLDGQQVDPVRQGVAWKMNYTKWNDAGQPTQGQGRATVKDPKNNYEAVADFVFDEKGYKEIKLTVSGGSLSKEMSASASRP